MTTPEQPEDPYDVPEGEMCADCHAKEADVWYLGLCSTGRWLCLDCAADRRMEE